MRGLLQQFAILEGPRLGLVGVAHEVLLDRAVRQEGHLLAHLKAGAAAPAQARGFNLGEDLLGRQAERAAQRLVATPPFVYLAGREPGLIDSDEQQRRRLGGLRRRGRRARAGRGAGAAGELLLREHQPCRRCAAASAGRAAECGSGYSRMRASISARSSTGTSTRAGSGTLAGSFARSTPRSQSGAREPWSKRGGGGVPARE